MGKRVRQKGRARGRSSSMTQLMKTVIVLGACWFFYTIISKPGPKPVQVTPNNPQRLTAAVESPPAVNTIVTAPSRSESVQEKPRTQSSEDKPDLKEQYQRELRRTAERRRERHAKATVQREAARGALNSMLNETLRQQVDTATGVGSAGSGSQLCGRPTQDGSPCRRPVSGGGPCYQHGG
jgi:hypothetical protein